MRISPIITAILILASSNVLAGEIKGAGATTCGLWLSDRSAGRGEYTPQLNWVLGYISSYNHFVYRGKNKNGVFGSVDPDAIAAWLDRFCKENPLDTVFVGTNSLVDELKARDIDQ